MGRRRGQAKTLTKDQRIASRELALKHPTHPYSFALILALSQDVGLCVREIAPLRLGAFTDAAGKLRGSVYIGHRPNQSGIEGRIMPISKDCEKYIRRLFDIYCPLDPVAMSPRSPQYDPEPMSAEAVSKWITRHYIKMGLEGCSSHSGRRTFGTGLAHQFSETKADICELQMLMGHARPESTVKYLHADELLSGLDAWINELGSAEPAGRDNA